MAKAMALAGPMCAIDWKITPPSPMASRASPGLEDARIYSLRSPSQVTATVNGSSIRSQEGADPPQVLRVETQARGPDHAIDLLRAAGADDGGGDRRMAQGPGDGHLARRTPMARSDAAQHLHQALVAR